ncbi:MAG TPA: hypothetical protein VFC10_00190 [Terriglobia bacterium]|jgi:hypothetical protein|nr:hypothetical protein [Terriglobia bacterium]
MTIYFLPALGYPVLVVVNLGVVVPLALACLVLMVVIPAAAWRGKLNVPLYALLMFALAFIAYPVGRIAGSQSMHGTTLGVVIAIIFFLLVATAGGCFFGILFYRQPVATDEEPTAAGENMSSPVAALDKDRR